MVKGIAPAIRRDDQGGKAGNCIVTGIINVNEVHAVFYWSPQSLINE